MTTGPNQIPLIRKRRRWRPLVLFLLAIGLVGAGLLAWRVWPATQAYYTDADLIRSPVETAVLRDILWQPPGELPEVINTAEDDYEPKVSGDGSMLFFVRGKAGHNANLYVAVRTIDRWSEPKPLDALNSEYEDLGPEPSADGQYLYFYSDRPGSLGGYDIFVSKRTGDDRDEWSEPSNLGPAVNSEFNDYGPALSPDGKTLYFASNRTRAEDTNQPSPDAWPATVREDLYQRDYDLYVSSITDRGAGRAQPLDALNSKYNDGTPAVSPVGDFVYFSSDRPGGSGGFDLYRSRRLHGEHQPPTNLGVEVNSSANELDPGLTLSGYGLFFSSDRPLSASSDPLLFSFDHHSAERMEQEKKVTAGNSAVDYNLYYTMSREVFYEMEHVEKPPIDWAGLWTLIGPNLLWALLALLALLLMLWAMGSLRSRRMSLLAKCLLGSMLLHLLLLLLFNIWEVTTSIVGELRRGGAIEISLIPSARANEITAQIMASPVNVDASEPAEFQLQQYENGFEYEPQTRVESLEVERVEYLHYERLQDESQIQDAAVPQRNISHGLTDVEPEANENPATVQLPQEELKTDAEESVRQVDTSSAATSLAKRVEVVDSSSAGAEPFTKPVELKIAANPNHVLQESMNESVNASIVFAVQDANARRYPPAHESHEPSLIIEWSQSLILETPKNSMQSVHAESKPTVNPQTMQAKVQPQRAIQENVSDSNHPQSLVEVGTDTNPLEFRNDGRFSAMNIGTSDSAASSHSTSAVVSSVEIPMESWPVTDVPLPKNESPSAAFEQSSVPLIAAKNDAQRRSASSAEIPNTTAHQVHVEIADQPEHFVQAGNQPLVSLTIFDFPDAAASPSPLPTLAYAQPIVEPRVELDLEVPVTEDSRVAAQSERVSASPKIVKSTQRDRPATASMDQQDEQSQPIELTPQIETAAPIDPMSGVVPDVLADDATVTTRSSIVMNPGTSVLIDVPNQDVALPQLAESPAHTEELSSDQPQQSVMDSARASDVELSRDDKCTQPTAVLLTPRALVLNDRAPSEDVERLLRTAHEARAAEPNRAIDPATGATPQLIDELMPSLALPIEIEPREHPFPERVLTTRRSIVEELVGSDAAERAVELALKWLAKHQSADGSWSGNQFDQSCHQCGGETEYQVSMMLTGLSVLSFLGADHTHVQDGPYRDVVDKAVEWLRNRQKPNGDLSDGETLLSHAIAALALAESYAITGDVRLEEVLHEAVDYSLKTQDVDSGGWPYEPGEAPDTSVTGWQVMALNIAQLAGVDVPSEHFMRVGRWLDQVSPSEDSGVYAHKPGERPTPSMTAQGLFTQFLLDRPPSDPRNRRSIGYLLRELPEWSNDSTNTYMWHFATLALFQARGDAWEIWNKHLTDALVDHQHKKGARAGSWDPIGQWAENGGRVYQTAICALTLESYYRYPPTFSGDQLYEPVGMIEGWVTDANSGDPLADAAILLDVPDSEAIVAISDVQGHYSLTVPELPEFFALSASKEGFLPQSINISSEKVKRGPVRRDFHLEPQRPDIIVLESMPKVHHLGDNRFEGRINSRFQKRSEGDVYHGTFEVAESVLSKGYRTAEIRLLAKGVQRGHIFFINGEELETRLDEAPNDGSFGEFEIRFDVSLLKACTNRLELHATAFADDIDDFEFVNLQIRLLP